jgi:hypothetical protein
MTDKPSGKARGGVARAEALSPDQRKEIAQKAAAARWNPPGLSTDFRKAVVPLREGDLTLTFPSSMSSTSVKMATTHINLILEETRTQAEERERSRNLEYQVALTDGGANTYASTSILAKDDSDAKIRAKHWVASLDTRWDDAWLVLNVGGRGITLKPGDF